MARVVSLARRCQCRFLSFAFTASFRARTTVRAPQSEGGMTNRSTFPRAIHENITGTTVQGVTAEMCWPSKRRLGAATILTLKNENRDWRHAQLRSRCRSRLAAGISRLRVDNHRGLDRRPWVRVSQAGVVILVRARRRVQPGPTANRGIALKVRSYSKGAKRARRTLQFAALPRCNLSPRRSSLSLDRIRPAGRQPHPPTPLPPCFRSLS